MNITIKTKNVELVDQLKSFVDKKIGGLKKFLNDFQDHHLPITEGRNLFDIFVEIKKETLHHHKGQIFKTEAKVYLLGKNLFTQSEGDNVMGTIIDVRNALEKEIRKYKLKIIEFPRRKYRKTLQKNQGK